jgi:anion-transporting  ArsA/GET3 family ATPase
MAMEKLGQLHATGEYDLVVVDTPPTRSALDFLDAPERLSTFLDGRLVKVLLAPAKAGGRAYLKVFGVFTNAISRIIGAAFLQDVSQFVGAMETMFGGFRERAQATYELLKDPATAFVVVATPERDALREAAYFVERLNEEAMPLAGLVVNRAAHAPAGRLSAERALAAAERLEDDDEGTDPDDHDARVGHEGTAERADDGTDGGTDGGADGGTRRLTAALLRLHADRARIVARETRLRQRFATVHPDVPTAVVPALPVDVHDLAGLRRVGELLAASGS